MKMVQCQEVSDNNNKQQSTNITASLCHLVKSRLHEQNCSAEDDCVNAAAEEQLVEGEYSCCYQSKT